MQFHFDKASAEGPSGQNAHFDRVLTKALFFNATECFFIEDSDGKLGGAALALSVPQEQLLEMLWRPHERARLGEILGRLPNAVHAVLVIREKDIVAQVFSSGTEAKMAFRRFAAISHAHVRQMQ